MVYINILEFSVYADIFHVIRMQFILSKIVTYCKKINTKKKKKRNESNEKKAVLTYFKDELPRYLRGIHVISSSTIKGLRIFGTTFLKTLVFVTGVW